jgi:hypothetical protein
VHNLKGNGDMKGNGLKLGSPLGVFSNASPDVFIGCIMKRKRERNVSQWETRSAAWPTSQL